EGAPAAATIADTLGGGETNAVGPGAPPMRGAVGRRTRCRAPRRTRRDAARNRDPKDRLTFIETRRLTDENVVRTRPAHRRVWRARRRFRSRTGALRDR